MLPGFLHGQLHGIGLVQTAVLTRTLDQAARLFARLDAVELQALSINCPIDLPRRAEASFSAR
ncbi:MAG: hypothetical protein IPH43_03060 [Xanthomonadales bacterium]|nr:hypothetical protein [Xanthomonadales bacterium]